MRRILAALATVILGASVLTAASPAAGESSATPTPSATPEAVATPLPRAGFPTAVNVGLPAGWKPTRTITGTYRITTPGQVVENVRFENATVRVEAKNVTIRNVEGINTYVSAGCRGGLVVDGSEFIQPTRTSSTDEAVGSGGYTFRNSTIIGYPEGLRVSGSEDDCGPVVVENAYLRIDYPADCGDWHGDGIQGYNGNTVTVRQTTIDLNESPSCGGTAPFFYPSGQGNTSVDIDGLLLSGGGYAFRLGMTGTVRNLLVVDKSWQYGPVDVNCQALSVWEARIVTLDRAGQPNTVGTLPCSGTGN